jgi:hypothetical protein
MWTPEHRLAADRRGLRYPSDRNKTRLARPIRYFKPRGIQIGGQFLVVVDGMPPRAPALFERGDRSQVASRDRGFQGLG